MTMTDPIADMLTGSQRERGDARDGPHAQLEVKEALAQILEREGYIAGLHDDLKEGRPGDVLEISLKYTPDRSRVIAG